MRAKALGVLGTAIFGAGVFAVVISSNLRTTAAATKTGGDDVFQLSGNDQPDLDPDYGEVHLALPAATGESGVVEIQNVSLLLRFETPVVETLGIRVAVFATLNGKSSVRYLPVHHHGHFPGEEIYVANETVRLFSDAGPGAEVLIVVDSHFSADMDVHASISGVTNP